MGQPPPVELSLIVVNYHSGEPLRRFFTSLDDHPVSAGSEVIVVDNSPGDGTAEWLGREHPDVHVIRMPRNRGYAGGVNAGLSEARGKHVLVVNPDVEFSAGAVDRALDYLRSHSPAGMVSVRLVNPDGSPQHNARRFYSLMSILLRRTPLGRFRPNHPALRRHLMLDDDLDVPGPVDWVTGAFMLVRRDALEDVGPMDERFFLYFEDVDWCYRMWEAGWEVHFLPDVELVHGFRRSSTRMSRSLLHHVRSFFGFYDKWGALVYVARHLRETWSLGAAIVSDLVALNLAFLTAFFVRRLLDPVFPQPLFDLVDYWPLILSVNLASLVVLPMTGRYGAERGGSRTSIGLSAIRAAFFVSLLVMSGTWLSYTRTFSRAVLLLFVPTYLGALALTGWLRERILGGVGTVSVARRALMAGPARIVGATEVQERLPGGYHLAGVLTADDPAVGAQRLLGDLGSIAGVVDRYRIHAVFLSREVPPSPRLVSILRRLASEGVEVHVDEPWSGQMAAPSTGDHSREAWVKLAVPPLLGRGAVAKSLADAVVALALALVSLPGYLLFSTVGAGFGVRSRSVTLPGSGARWRELSARGGRLLPGWVQLPRFLQVLRGNLSLVGPEPHPTSVDSVRLRPGLALPVLSGQVLDEAAYCERWSLALDFECLLRQPGALLGAGRVQRTPVEADRPGED